jgi:hypothetical protein
MATLLNRSMRRPRTQPAGQDSDRQWHRASSTSMNNMEGGGIERGSIVAQHQPSTASARSDGSEREHDPSEPDGFDENGKPYKPTVRDRVWLVLDDPSYSRVVCALTVIALRFTTKHVTLMSWVNEIVYLLEDAFCPRIPKRLTPGFLFLQGYWWSISILSLIMVSCTAFVVETIPSMCCGRHDAVSADPIPSCISPSCQHAR